MFFNYSEAMLPLDLSMMETMRAVSERPVLSTANPIIAIQTSLRIFHLLVSGSSFSQKIAGKKKETRGATVLPIRPRTISRGGLMEAMSQVKRRMAEVVA